MAEQPPEKKKPAELIVRIIVWGTLGVIVALASFDIRAKMASESTGDAWRDAYYKAQDANQDLHRSQLQEYLSGAPEIISGEADKHKNLSRTVERYTWKGMFRDYTVSVYLGLGNDPSVEFIEGPAKAADDARSASQHDTKAPTSSNTGKP